MEANIPIRSAGAMIAALTIMLVLPAPGCAQQGIDLTSLGYNKGDPAAPIAVIEFGDFGCSACGLFARETMAPFYKEFIATGRVQWKFVPFVLGNFPNSEDATLAALCAAEQDAFWSMHDRLYTDQKKWIAAWKPRARFIAYAEALHLDARRFADCYDRRRPAQRIERNNEVAHSLGINATPTFFVNGTRARGALPMEQWREIIRRLEAGNSPPRQRPPR